MLFCRQHTTNEIRRQNEKLRLRIRRAPSKDDEKLHDVIGDYIDVQFKTSFGAVVIDLVKNSSAASPPTTIRI